MIALCIIECRQTMAHYCTHLCRQRTILHSIMAVVPSREFRGAPILLFLTTYIYSFSELVVRWMLKVPLEVNLLLPWQHLLDIWTYLKCLSITGKEFCTIFCFAFTLVTKFFNHRADVDCVDDHGWTTMHETILGKSVEVAEYLNKIRPKMKFKACQQGRTSLHLAAFCDSPKALLRYVIRMIKHHYLVN